MFTSAPSKTTTTWTTHGRIWCDHKLLSTCVRLGGWGDGFENTLQLDYYGAQRPQDLLGHARNKRSRLHGQTGWPGFAEGPGKHTLFDTSNQVVYKGCKIIQASRHLMNYFQCQGCLSSQQHPPFKTCPGHMPRLLIQISQCSSFFFPTYVYRHIFTRQVQVALLFFTNRCMREGP